MPKTFECDCYDFDGVSEKKFSVVFATFRTYFERSCPNPFHLAYRKRRLRRKCNSCRFRRSLLRGPMLTFQAKSMDELAALQKREQERFNEEVTKWGKRTIPLRELDSERFEKRLRKARNG